MATSPAAQQALSAIASRGKRSSPSSVVATLLAQQQDSQDQMSKLIQTIEKLQQENVETVQRAGEAGGAAATQVANQVTRGIEQARDKAERGAERSEDKQFAVEQQELNAELQKQAAREAAILGESIKLSREKYISSINTMRDRQSDLDASMTAYSARTEEMVRDGKFKGPEGRKNLQERFDRIKQARVYGDNMFDARHLRAAFNVHERYVNSLRSSDDPMNPTSRIVDPIDLPMVKMKGDSSPVSSLSKLSPDQQFDLEMTSGYPPNGLVFPREENFGLPEGEQPNLIHPATMVDIARDEDVLRGLTDESLRQEYVQGIQKNLVTSHDQLNQLMKTYKSLNVTYNQKALQGVEAALEDFVEDPDVSKMNDPGRYIITRALTHTFGSGRQGEEMAQIAMEFFDGKREPKSAEDFLMLMAVESASFNIGGHLTSEVQSAADPEKGGSLSTQLVKQMEKVLGRDETLRVMGVEASDTALVDLQSVMQDRIMESLGFARRLNDGMKSFSLFKQYKDQWRSTLQQMDIHAYKTLADGTQREARVQELVGQLTRSPEEGGPSLEKVQNQEGFKNMESTMTLTGALLGMAEEVGPNVHAGLSGFLTNVLDPVTDVDLKGYTNQISVEEQRSGYAKPAILFSRFAHDRQKRGKQTAPIGESFQKGGVPAVVKEQLPALISMGNRGLLRTTLGAARNLGQVVAGEKITKPFDTGVQAALGRLPLPAPGETAQMQNLTLEEKEQVIRESNRGVQ